MVELKNVSKRYLNKKAVENVSIQLPSGKMIGIVGENGAGKSTLLKMIAGLVKPTKGMIWVDREPVTRQICHKVAYLSELDTYYPFYTVDEMIRFHASQFADFSLQTAKELLEFMQLDPNQKVKDLSKGGRGRVRILLTLSRKAPFILMDEPFSGLDPLVRDALVKGLISFVDLQKQTIIMTTHDVKEVEGMLDILVAVRHGKIIKMIEVEELRSSEGMSIAEWMNQSYAKSL